VIGAGLGMEGIQVACAERRLRGDDARHQVLHPAVILGRRTAYRPRPVQNAKHRSKKMRPDMLPLPFLSDIAAQYRRRMALAFSSRDPPGADDFEPEN
jgi:hypothetical protein